jgi:hypothetical protein
VDQWICIEIHRYHSEVPGVPGPRRSISDFSLAGIVAMCGNEGQEGIREHGRSRHGSGSPVPEFLEGWQETADSCLIVTSLFLKNDRKIM